MKAMECKNCGSTDLVIVLHSSFNDTYSQWATGEWKKGLHKDFKPYLVRAICSKCASELTWSEYQSIAKKFKARIPFTTEDRLKPRTRSVWE